jgi:hypothetical protein
MRSGRPFDYLENSAAQFPDRLAAMDPDGASLTYRALIRSFQPVERA